MAEQELSPVKKIESALDDFVDLWRRRRAVCVVVLTILFVGFGTPIAGLLLERHKTVGQLGRELEAAKVEVEATKKELAKAGATMLEQRTELEGKVAERTNEIQRLETQLVPFRTLAMARYPGEEGQALARLAEDLRGLEREVRALQEQTRERRLSETQRVALTTALAKCSGSSVRFSVPWGDGEAASFAGQLMKAFAAAGWKAPEGLERMVYRLEEPKGIYIMAASPELAHPCAGDVQKAFAAAGLNAPPSWKPGEGTEVLRITVGHKE